MQKAHYTCLILIIFGLFFIALSPALAMDEPFDGQANWGGTGLMDTPTARVLTEGRYRLGVSQIHPYRYYYGAVSPFKGVEIDGRITEVIDLPASSAATWQGYGNYKDKAVGLKWQFLPEGKWWPALALGIADPHGTRVYPANYLVASKQIYPFDFTIGMGDGRYGKKPLPSQGEGFKLEMFQHPRTWLADSQFFGGIEFASSEKLSFILEYSPIRYHEQIQDPAQAKYFRDAVRSPFNFGLRWRPYSWANIAVSWQRGEEIGINLAMAFNLGNPLVPIYDHPYRERAEQRLLPLERRMAQALYESGFADISIILAGDELIVEAENDKYFFQPRAISVALRALNEIAPPSVRRIRLVLINRRMPVISFETSRDDLNLFLSEKLSVNEFLRLSNLATDIFASPAGGLPRQHAKYFDYGVKPEFRFFLNDPSGFFKYRVGASGWASYRAWRGASLVAGLEFYPLNNVSSVNQPLSVPVRSDSIPYMQDNLVLSMLMMEQLEKFPHEIYGKIAAGILEVQYAGLDGEVARPFFDGRLFMGASGSVVKKREAGSPFGLREKDVKDYYTTAFFNTRLNIPELEAAIDLKAGQFLAGDRGIRVTLSKFFNGVILSAWYSATDTSMFNDPHNRGYHDKGIAITIPLRHFRGADSRSAYTFAVSPWTRDVAQDISRHTSLFDHIGRNSGIYLKKDRFTMH